MKALITQREQIDPYGVSIDVLESTYVTYFESLGIDLFQLSNFTINLEKILEDNNFEIIILTGGGAIPNQFYNGNHNNILQPNRDRLEWLLMEYSKKKEIPILGICRGMEYMNAFLGGGLANLSNLKEKRPIGKEHLISFGDETQICVNNYHNDGIYMNDLAKEYEIIGLDLENNIVEALYSRKLKWIGFQWHPERLMKDLNSKIKCNKLIKEFIGNRGDISESYYLSSRTRN